MPIIPIIQPMRKIAPSIILKDASNSLEKMKYLGQQKQKLLCFRCDANIIPPPNGGNDLNKAFSPEKLEKIQYAFKNNLLTKNFLSMMNYNKV